MGLMQGRRSQIWPVLPGAALLLSAGLLLAACGTPNPQPAGPTAISSPSPGEAVTLVPALQGSGGVPVLPTAEPADAAARGASIFVLNCVKCHGLQGQGLDGPPLRSNQFVETGSTQAVYDTIANGRADTEMPAWLIGNGGSLTAAEIRYVMAFLATMQGHSGIARPATPPPGATESAPAPGATPEPAKPTGSGGPGGAVDLTGDVDQGRLAFGAYCAACHGPEGRQGVPNEGSDDGSVPPLNPIDPSLVSSDYKTFASNVDLFIEHGSVPAGEDPQVMMPPFGDGGMLSDQQIADLLAYVLSLNGVEAP